MPKTSGSFQKGHKYCGPKEGSFFKRKHSEETIQKIKNKKIGQKYPNRKSPPPLTEEHRNNIKKSNTGLKRTGLALQNIINTNQKPWTDERRRKMSILKTGREVSKKTREKIRQGKFKNPTKYWKGKKRLGMVGDKNHAWKGGITPENVKIRHSIEYKLFRDSVFARDGYICQKYGIKGVKFNAHHIQNFAKYPELRFAIDNGVTLSDKAHKEFHKKYGKKYNTREQLEEFLKT